MFEENFFAVWKRFLEMEIIRSKHCVEFTGTANAYLVLQVICWHQFLIVGEELEDGSLESTISEWYEQSRPGVMRNKKLSYALIAELTSLDKETVRRNVKALEAKGWVQTSRKEGIVFTANPEMNEKLMAHNEKERKLVSGFAATLASLSAPAT